MNTDPPIVSVIIISYNVSKLLEACLDSLYSHAGKFPFEVLVVDNASTDDSRQMVNQKFPQVRLFASQKNLGFAGGNNLAIPRARGQYLLLLNPDTVVLPDALDELVYFLDAQPQAGAAGSKLLNPDGSLQESCFPFPGLLRESWRMLHLDALYPLARYPMEDWSPALPHSVDVIQGASLMLRKTALDQTGILDETFFMYSEEVDLCYRLKKNGWSLHYIPSSAVIHYGGQSTRQTAERMFLQLYQSKILFFRKHYGPAAAGLYKLMLYFSAALRVLLSPLAYLISRSQRDKFRSTAALYAHLMKALPQY